MFEAGVRMGFIEDVICEIIPRPGDELVSSKAYIAKTEHYEDFYQFSSKQLGSPAILFALETIQNNKHLFKQNLHNYVDIDTQIDRLNKDIKTLREQKKQLEQTLISQFKSQNLNNTRINVNNYQLSLGSESVVPVLSYKYLEEQLAHIFHDKSRAHQLVNTIKNNREKKQEPIIKIKK